jgi:hypothetical protein
MNLDFYGVFLETPEHKRAKTQRKTSFMKTLVSFAPFAAGDF